MLERSKICIRCGINKTISEFRAHKNGVYEGKCRPCELEYNRVYYAENREKRIAATIKCNNKNRVRCSEYDKEYRAKNKAILAEKANIRRKTKRKENPAFRLRIMISSIIAGKLNKSGSSKNCSIMKRLPYTIEELKNHIESQFEPWMNWENHGRYHSGKWDENDSTTWRWQLDHIIPQTDLPYDSMDSENFMKCWELSNLRPYSAKQNVLDGVNRIRHNKIF